MGGGIHTFLATKSWHTGGQRSRAAVESAEARERERQAAAKRRAAEVEKDRQRLEEARARGGDAAAARHVMDFMYAPPPGLPTEDKAKAAGKGVLHSDGPGEDADAAARGGRVAGKGKDKSERQEEPWKGVPLGKPEVFSRHRKGADTPRDPLGGMAAALRAGGAAYNACGGAALSSGGARPQVGVPAATVEGGGDSGGTVALGVDLGSVLQSLSDSERRRFLLGFEEKRLREERRERSKDKEGHRRRRRSTRDEDSGSGGDGARRKRHHDSSSQHRRRDRSSSPRRSSHRSDRPERSRERHARDDRDRQL